MRFSLIQVIFFIFIFIIYSEQSHAQNVLEPGVLEKSLEQSRPTFSPPLEDEPPEIIIEDSRKLKDPGAGPSFFVKKVIVEGNTLIDDEALALLVDMDGGMEVTLGILSLMANEITAEYAIKGYFLTRAFVPQQEMVDGIVKIQVLEGRIGKVIIEGNKRYNSKGFLDRMKPVREEKVLREQTLEETLLELNSMLGIKVRSILRPGELPGTSNLILNVTESRRYQFSYDMDNFGSHYTGTNKIGLTGTVGGVLTMGDQFSTRWSTTDMVFDSYAPSYIFPVNTLGTKLRLAYSFSENELGRSLKNKAMGGSSHSYTWELSHPLAKARDNQIAIRGGMNFRIGENETVSDNTISKEDTQDVYFGLGGNFTDSYLGRNFYDIKAKLGLRLARAFEPKPSRVGGNDNALTSNLSLTRIQRTKYFNSFFTIKLNGQVAGKRLISGSKVSYGGMGTVRGYTLAEIGGDMGYSASIDYTIPYPKKWKLPLGSLEKFFKDWPALSQTLTLNMFADYGRMFTLDKTLSEKTDEDIAGTGLGLTLNIPKKENKHPGFSFSVAYAVPMFGSLRRPNASPDHTWGMVYLSGMTNY